MKNMPLNNEREISAATSAAYALIVALGARATQKQRAAVETYAREKQYRNEGRQNGCAYDEARRALRAAVE